MEKERSSLQFPSLIDSLELRFDLHVSKRFDVALGEEKEETRSLLQ